MFQNLVQEALIDHNCDQAGFQQFDNKPAGHLNIVVKCGLNKIPAVVIFCYVSKA